MLFGKSRVTKLLQESGVRGVVQKFGNNAITPLFDIMREEKDLSLRKKAAEAIEAIGYQCINSEERVIVLKSALRLTELAEMGEISIKPLLSLLCHNNWLVREAAAEALEKIGDIIIDSLTPFLKYDDIGIRKIVANMLSNLRYSPKRDADLMIYLLANQKWDQVTNHFSLEQTVLYLKDEQYNVRYYVEKSLFDESESIDKIINLSKKGNDSIKEGAMLLLSEFPFYHIPWYDEKGDDYKIQRLYFEEKIKSLLLDENHDMRLFALKILEMRGFIQKVNMDNEFNHISNFDKRNDIIKQLKKTKDELGFYQAALQLLLGNLVLEDWQIGSGIIGDHQARSKLLNKIQFLKGITSNNFKMVPCWSSVFNAKSKDKEIPANFYLKIGLLSCPNDMRLIPSIKDIMMTNDDIEIKKLAAEKLEVIGFYPMSKVEWLSYMEALGKLSEIKLFDL
jgi:hypothetical protein